MATIGAGMQVNIPVSATATGNGVFLVYTSPSQSMVILNFAVDIAAGAVGTLLVDGKKVWECPTGAAFFPTTITPMTIYLGPSQPVTFSSGGSNATVYLTGVVITNVG